MITTMKNHLQNKIFQNPNVVLSLSKKFLYNLLHPAPKIQSLNELKINSKSLLERRKKNQKLSRSDLKILKKRRLKKKFPVNKHLLKNMEKG